MTFLLGCIAQFSKSLLYFRPNRVVLELYFVTRKPIWLTLIQDQEVNKALTSLPKSSFRSSVESDSHLSSDWLKNFQPSFDPIRSKIWFDDARFPTLRISYTCLLRVFIDSMNCLRPLSLVRVIIVVLIFIKVD